MNRKFSYIITALFAGLLLAGCGSSGIGDILGGGDSSTVGNDQSVVRGTVDRVDTRNRTIVLRDADTDRSQLQNRSGSDDVVYLDYDENTVVEYGGERYAPTALEPGDRIEANAEMIGNRLVAGQISVTYDVSGTGTTNPSTVTDLRGTVTDIDTRSRMITVQEDSWNRTGQTHRFSYETNTPVYWQGRVYQPENLERGDVIEVDLTQSGSTLIARQIEVVESSSQQTSARFEPDLRGTVVSVDSRASTITLQQPTWIQRFNTGTNTSSNVTLRYDNSTTVEYNGQLYAPENLERGDTVEVDVNDLGSTLMAEKIVVVSNVRQSEF